MSELVVVCLDSAEENWRECADVLFSTRPRPPAEAWLLAGLVLWRYPGCLLVLLPGAGGDVILRMRAGVMAGIAADPPPGGRELG
ncbi:hypothetical protein [Streptomyces sp. NPDC047042]|uniref:hypothetical protein n=1 Tax=Streptomyces sp. NPDC047042 TaxID=3154807 RepID=UPI0033C81E03